ncbi:MAG: M20/M25/M40 family metallo-hydrolase [Gemmatimonadota bacterium]
MEIRRLASDPAVMRARALLRGTDAVTLDDQLRIVRIPAPPFGEGRRAAWLAERFRETGLDEVGIDEAGNVLGRLPAAGPGGGRRSVPGAASRAGAEVVVAAHLDTIFDAEAEVRPRRDGDRWIAPGITDNARGVAVLLALARALVAARVGVARPVVFAGTVGEEGEGDLRGAKHLFRRGGGLRRAAAFIALDGAGCDRVVHRALGARRFRFTVTGPGGHSWVDRERPNPIHALGRAVAALADLEPTGTADATVSVGRIRGGTRVNALPEEAWCEVDVRGDEAAALDALTERVCGIVTRACERESARATARARRVDDTGGRSVRALAVAARMIGDRPTGETPPDSELVRAARSATRLVGGLAELATASTDANVPIALGIPSIALGAGGRAGGIHSTAEWFRNERGVEGAERALLVVLAAAGLARARG